MSPAGPWRWQPPAPAQWPALDGVDPHAAWAGLTRWPAGAGTRSDPVPVLLELAAQVSPAQRQAIAALVRPPAVCDRVHGRFWTGAVEPAQLDALARLPGLRRWRLGLASTPRTEGAAMATRAPRPPRGDAPWVGVIDHGIAFAHRAFRDARGRTRIAAFWNPQATPGGPWQAVAGLGYGAELDAAAIDAGLRRDGFDEMALYRRLGYAPAQLRGAHGTHVLDLLAGRPDPRRALHGGIDAASDARIVAVQLPHRPLKDTSGQSLVAQVLDALHYIVARVPHRRPVVVNLSDGAYGGPHDGASLLECAIDDFLQRHPQVRLVLAAGNAHELGLHAAAPALAAGECFVCDWRVPPEDPTESFLELWLDAPGPLARGAVRLQLQPPGGLPAVRVALGESAVLAAGGPVLGAVFSRVDAPNRPGRSQFLVALAPTLRGPSAVAATLPHGLWRVVLEGVDAPAPLAVDAWVERDDPALGDRGPRRQSVLLGPLVTGVRTLGSLAGSGRAVVVGARYERGEAFSGARPAGAMTIEARYSSRGPGRADTHPQGRDGVDVLAPGDESPLLHGVLAAGNRSGTQRRMGGTSVAAPQHARQLVNAAAAKR